MPQFTPTTIMSPDAFIVALDEVRALGYGLDDAQNQPHGRCVGVVIPKISIPAGIRLSAPADRFPAESTAAVVAQLVKAAKQISKKMNPGPLPRA
jgi:IclR family acetate operon transcriptional repressor